MIFELLEILAPVFIMAGIGFAWTKSGRSLDTNQFTPLIVWVGSPCLIFSALMKSNIGLAELTEIAWVALGIHICAATLGVIALKALRLPVRAFLPALTLPNTGNMGLSLCLFAFGDVGLALGVAYFTVSALLQFTFGVSVSANRFSWKRAIATPHIYAIAAAVAMLWTDTPVPVWIGNTVSLLGQFTIPLMLLFLGVSLAKLTVGAVGRAVILSVVRIGGGLAIGLGFVWLAGLDGTAAGIVLIQASMPVAVFNYLLAQYYDNSPAEVAGLVVVSTVMSFATLPLLLAVIL